MSIIFDSPDGPQKLNKLAREWTKQKLLQDIIFDMEVCKLEGRCIKEYIKDIKNMLDKIIEKNNL